MKCIRMEILHGKSGSLLKPPVLLRSKTLQLDTEPFGKVNVFDFTNVKLKSYAETLLRQEEEYNVLCLGSHCDDIEIGCGGTMLRLSRSYQLELPLGRFQFKSGEEKGSSKERVDVFKKCKIKRSHSQEFQKTAISLILARKLRTTSKKSKTNLLLISSSLIIEMTFIRIIG